MELRYCHYGAEILPIWTNVARRNVAWTNDHLTTVLDWQELMGNSLLKRFYDQRPNMELRYCQYGQMSPGEMLHGQMTIRQLS